MPTLTKIKKAKPAKAKARGSAIDSAQRELLERQNEVQAQIDALQRSLKQDNRSPAGTTRRGQGAGGTSTPSGGYKHRVTVVEAPPRRPPPKRPTLLRAERIAARRQTMALLVFLTAAVIYALSHLLP